VLGRNERGWRTLRIFEESHLANGEVTQKNGNGGNLGFEAEMFKVIAHELLTSLKSNITVDWTHRESARTRMRVLVKRILRKYGYPSDLQDSAVQTVLQQAEALSAAWSR
jgi:hypothetical protein